MNDFNLNKPENHNQFKTILFVISSIKKSQEQNIKLLDMLAKKIEERINGTPAD